MSHNPRKASRSKKNENPRLKSHTIKDQKSSKRKGGSRDDDNDLQETLWNGPASESEDEAKNQGEDEEDDEEEQEEYEVEEILDKKIKKGTVLYLVKWKGFSLEDTTWEPATNLENAPLKIKNFENQLLAKEKEKETGKEKEKEKEKDETPTKSKASKPTTEQQKEEGKSHDVGSAPKGANKESNAPQKSMDLKKVMEPEALPSKRMRDQVDIGKEISKETTVTDEARKKIKKQAEKGKGGASEVIVPHPRPEKNIENKKIEKKAPEEKSKSKEVETEKKVQKKDLKTSMVVEEKAPAPQEKPTPMEEEEDELTFKIKKLSGKSNSIRLDSDSNVPPQIRKEDSSLKEKEGAPGGSEQLYRATSSSLGQAEQDKSAQAARDIAENKPIMSVQNASKGDEGVSLSRIMQDEKLMEESETEEPSVNNDDAEMKDNTTKAITKIRKKSGGEYGSLEKGDVPLKVVGIRPIKEESDLEVMISWKARENGTKPYNSKVMRLEMLRYGYWMPLIEFYESKMKLESAPNFDPAALPKY